MFDNRENEKEAYEAYIDRLYMNPCIEDLTEDEIEELRKQGRV